MHLHNDFVECRAAVMMAAAAPEQRSLCRCVWSCADAHSRLTLAVVTHPIIHCKYTETLAACSD